MNEITLLGRLTKDIEVKDVNGNVFCNFTLACNRNFKNKDGEYGADFVPCTAYSKTANFLSQYFRKGDLMIVHGEWRTGNYEKGGQRIYTNTCAVKGIEFVPRSASDSNNSNNSNDSVADSFESIPDGMDMELPFN